MKRCKVCNAKLILTNDRRYVVMKPTTAISKLLCEQITAYECFDCPQCGCQNIVNVREGAESELVPTSN